MEQILQPPLCASLKIVIAWECSDWCYHCCTINSTNLFTVPLGINSTSPSRSSIKVGGFSSLNPAIPSRARSLCCWPLFSNKNYRRYGDTYDDVDVESFVAALVQLLHALTRFRALVVARLQRTFAMLFQFKNTSGNERCPNGSGCVRLRWQQKGKFRQTMSTLADYQPSSFNTHTSHWDVSWVFLDIFSERTRRGTLKMDVIFHRILSLLFAEKLSNLLNILRRHSTCFWVKTASDMEKFPLLLHNGAECKVNFCCYSIPAHFFTYSNKKLYTFFFACYN